MEYNYLILLDYAPSSVKIIKFTDEEREESNNYEDFEDYLSTLEDKYNFRLKDVYWMTAESLDVTGFKEGKEVAYAELV